MPEYDVSYQSNSDEIVFSVTVNAEDIQRMKAYKSEEQNKEFSELLRKVLAKDFGYRLDVKKVVTLLFCRRDIMQNKQHYWLYDTYYRTITEGESSKLFPFGVWLPALVGEGYYMYLDTFEEAKRVAVEDIQEQIEELKECLIRIENMKG